MEGNVPPEDYAIIKQRVLSRIAEYELKRAIEEQDAVIPAASIEKQPSTEADFPEKLAA